MPLYKPNSNPAALAQSAMSGATQAAASQTRQTTVNVKKESNFWDDLYKGAAALNMGARAVGGMVDVAQGAWNMYDKYKLRDAYGNIDKAYRDGGFEAIQSNPDMQDYWHSQALGQFVKDRASNEKGRLEMLQNMDAAADKIYQGWRTEAMSVRDAYNSGHMQKFMPMMRQLAANSPLPYRLEPDERGNFKVMFRSDRHGGWTDTGRTMTPQEAMGEVNNILRGEQMVLRGVDMKLSPANEAFISSARRAYWGTVIGNAENRIDPKKQIPLYDANGKLSGLGVLQSPVDDYNAVQKLVVFGRDGRQIGVFDGYDGAMRAGLSPFKPEKSKGGAGNGVNSKAYALIKDLATVVDPATGEKNIDVEMAAALERGIASGYAPYQYAQKLTRDMDAYARDIARNNPQLTPEEVHQYARGQAFATSRSSGSTDPLGLRGGSKQTSPAARPSTTDARIRDALTDGRQDYEAGRGATAPALPSDINPLGNISGPTLDDMLGQNNSWSAQTRGNMARQKQSQEMDQAFGSAMEDFTPGNYGHGSFAPQNKGTLAAHYDRRREQDRADNAVKRMRSLHPGY